MEGNMMLLFPVVCPIAAGIGVLAGKVFRKNRKYLVGLSAAVLVLSLSSLWGLSCQAGVL